MWKEGNPRLAKQLFAPFAIPAAISENATTSANQNVKNKNIKQIKDGFYLRYAAGQFRDADGVLLYKQDAASMHFDQLPPEQQNYFGRKGADVATRRESAIATLGKHIKGLDVRDPAATLTSRKSRKKKR